MVAEHCVVDVVQAWPVLRYVPYARAQVMPACCVLTQHLHLRFALDAKAACPELVERELVHRCERLVLPRPHYVEAAEALFAEEAEEHDALVGSAAAVESAAHSSP